MNKPTTPDAAAALPCSAPNPSALLFDMAGLDGLECRMSGWDEWDTCVAEQDLYLALLALRQRQLH